MSRTLDHYICECGYHFRNLGSLGENDGDGYPCPKCGKPMKCYDCNAWDSWDSDECSCPVKEGVDCSEEKLKQAYHKGLADAIEIVRGISVATVLGPDPKVCDIVDRISLAFIDMAIEQIELKIKEANK